MTEKSNQALQEEIDFLKGQVECLTGMAALHLTAYFQLTEAIADAVDPKIQIEAFESEQVVKNALDIGLRRANEEQNQDYIEGFNEAKTHYLEVLRALSR